MRIVSINNYMYRRGGAETVFLDHNELFESHGHEIAPFCMQHPSNNSSPYAHFFPTEVEYGESYTLGKKIMSASKVIYSWEARKKLEALITEFSPHLIHAHNIYHHLSTSVLHVAKKHGIPVVLTLHDLKLACPAYTMMREGVICEKCNQSTFNVLRHRCIKNSLLLSSVIFAEHHFVRLAGMYSNHITQFVVPSKFYIRKFSEWGVDTKKFNYVPNFSTLPEKSWHDCDKGYYLYIGRLSPEKGLDTLVTAFEGIDAKLMIAGDGVMAGELNKAIRTKENIEMLGYLGKLEISRYIQGARAVIVPSEWYENCPMSVIEAFALGKAVIASNIGGLSDMIDHESNGLLFEPGNSEELRETIAKFDILDKNKRSRYGLEARKKCSEKYSPDAYYNGIAKIYERALT